MAKVLSELMDVSPQELENLGAFDPVLDLDTRLFIDPHLLKHCDIEGFERSYEKFQEHFKKVIKLLNSSDSNGDRFWREADRYLEGGEVKGLCIGYSSKGTSGSGIGPELRKRLLDTAKEILDKGKNDPEIFELVGLFEEDFGPDRISDITANIIKDDLVSYTKRVMESVPLGKNAKLNICSDSKLPINPFTSEIILLVPSQILRDLPICLDWSNLDIVAQENRALREEVNGIIGDSWREAMKTVTKSKLKDIILEHPKLVDDLVRQYSAKPAMYYDFQEDKAGEYIWYPVTKEMTNEHPIALSLPQEPTIDEVEDMVLKICDKFRELIENNGLNRLLYDRGGHPKNESAAQLIFYGVAEAYCAANGIMIARESDSGRGPVDFKFGTRQENSVLVELKKSTNTAGLKKGIKKQLPEYMKSEKSKRAIYLVLDVGGFTKTAKSNLNDIAELMKDTSIKLIHVDGLIKPSASKMS